MTGLSRSIPRTIDDPTRILGLAPLELAGCALAYALLSPALRGVPFSALISLTLAFGVGVSLLVLNRAYPPAHSVHFALRLFRPRVALVASFGQPGKDGYERH